MNNPVDNLPQIGNRTSYSVLVIDDDMADRFRLIKTCKRAGLDAEFYEAANLEELRRLVTHKSFDIFFIDFHLGLSDGHEALEIITSSDRQADAISIMVTSVDRHDVIIQAMQNGCSDYLIKEELSVAAIQKSVALAFERQLVRATSLGERKALSAMKSSLDRFSSNIAPDMRRVMSAMLWRTRNIRSSGEGHLSQTHGGALEELCMDLFSIMDDFNVTDLQLAVPQSKPERPRLGNA